MVMSNMILPGSKQRTRWPGDPVVGLRWRGAGAKLGGMTIDVRPAAVFADVKTMVGPKRADANVCWCLSYRISSKQNRELVGPARKRERGDVISIRVREARCARAKGAGHEARAGRQRQRAHLLGRARMDAHRGPLNEAPCVKTALVTTTEDESSESA